MKTKKLSGPALRLNSILALGPLLALFVLPLLSRATLPAFDPFAYPADMQLYGQANAAGLTWVAAGPTGTNVVVAGGNLAYPGLAPSVGNSIQFHAGTGPSGRFPFGADITNGTVYFSFVFRAANLAGLGTSGGFFAGLNNSSGAQPTTPTVVGVRVLSRAVAGGGYNLGLSKASSTGADFVWATNVFTPQDTVLIVGSYTFNAGSATDDQARLWINPDPSSFGGAVPPSGFLSSVAGNDLPQISSFIFFQRPGALQPAVSLADELRVGDSWASVSPAEGGLDFGDAPARYPTLLVNNGARHSLAPGVYLGSGVDAESDGLPNASAGGDDAAGTDDEDGVTFPATLNQGFTYPIQVMASTNGFLDAWIDWNADGDWADAGEQLFTSSRPLVPGLNTVNIPIPTSAAATNTFARFRFSSAGGLSFAGSAPDGEVEDYPIIIERSGDLVVYKTVAVQTVPAGGSTTYTITVSNKGPSQVTNLRVTDPLPQGVLFRWLTNRVGNWVFTNNSVNGGSGNGTLNPGEDISVDITVEFDIPVDTTVVNEAHAIMNEPDLNQQDNSSSASVLIVAPNGSDFGDAPAPSYHTLLADNGARHAYSRLFLGRRIDYETNGKPNLSATGDDVTGGFDDEDGIIFLDPIISGTTVRVQVIASSNGLLNAWIDFNRNTNWDGPEQVLNCRPVVAGTNVLLFGVPPGLPSGYTYARFRLSTACPLGPEGPAANGEVEDYRIYLRGQDPLGGLRMNLVQGQPAVSWDGDEYALEAAPQVAGPYAPVAGTSSPLFLPPGDSRKFFRLRKRSGSISFAHMLKEADCVFDGVVSQVQYRMSDTNAQHQQSFPLTYVTFQVQDTLKGQIAGSSLTLCFIGGPGPNGTILHASDETLFDVGERSILFVRDNGRTALPLVGARSGRIRLAPGGLVNEILPWTEGGVEFLWSEEARINIGFHADLPEVRDNMIAGQLFQIVHPEVQGVEQPPAPPTQVRRMTFEQMVSYLRRLIEVTHTPEELAGLPPAVSMNIQTPFYVPEPKPRTLGNN